MLKKKNKKIFLVESVMGKYVEDRDYKPLRAFSSRKKAEAYAKEFDEFHCNMKPPIDMKLLEEVDDYMCSLYNEPTDEGMPDHEVQQCIEMLGYKYLSERIDGVLSYDKFLNALHYLNEVHGYEWLNCRITEIVYVS